MKQRVVRCMMLASIMMLGMGFLFTGIAWAAWSLRSGSGFNPLRVCQDGIYLEVGDGSIGLRQYEFRLWSEGEHGDVVFSGAFAPPFNPVPGYEDLLPYSDSYLVFWEEAVQPLAPNSTVDLNPSDLNDPVFVTVADCYISVGTAFTYQGNLNHPVNDVLDFQFKLFDAAQGGNKIGPTIIRDDVTVINGSYSVELDFRHWVLTRDTLWLEISILRSNVYHPLEDRDELFAVP